MTEMDPMTAFEQARWAFADAAVRELCKGFNPEVYTLMMSVLGTRAQQEQWARARGHRWASSGRFIPKNS